MKKKILSLLVLFCSVCPMYAQVSYADILDSSLMVAQMRVGADFNWKFKPVSVLLSEELRFNLTNPAAFSWSYTTLGLNCTIVPSYLNVFGGYTLRMKGDKFSTTDVNKILRHRFYLGLAEHVKLGMHKRVTLTLRERAILNYRTDSPNEFEKKAAQFYMRYRFQAQYKAASVPLTPYVWAELEHTCNATDFQKYYNNSHNYVSAVKTAIGLKWKLDATNSLDFNLRYYFNRDFDVDSNKKGTKVKSAYEVIQHSVLFGVCYSFDWKKR